MSGLSLVRKFVAYREEVLAEAGRSADGAPLVKVVTAAVIRNPAPGRWQDEVLTNMPASVEIAEAIADRAIELVGHAEIESFGKGALIGTNGDHEQGVSFLTGAFGDAVRQRVDAREWVSSVTKRAAPGASVDIPLAHKNVLQARSHYDAVTLMIPDAPGPDEIVVVFAVATRGRLNERCGGITVEEGMAK